MAPSFMGVSASATGVPASGTGGVDCPPQVPREEPGGVTQGSPGQQSAPVEHVAPVPEHTPPQMNADPIPPTVNDGFGTHGRPQQSALVAQAWPDFEPASAQDSAFIVQRGMPKMSCWQASGNLLTLPEQQSFSALQDIVASLQIAPAGRQAFPLSQRPTGSVALALLQLPTPVVPCTPPKPQQSESPRQISPVGRHPLGGWQIKMPVLYGAHARLQQEPPHVGRPDAIPPSPVVPAPQT